MTTSGGGKIARAGCAALAVLLATAPSARADDDRTPTEAPPVVLTPPRLLTRDPPPYPEGASGDADVVLVLEVDREGHVARAIVERGEPPFADAAVAAARAFLYEPARRDGKPVPAKVKALVTYRAVDAPVKGPPAAPAAEPAPAAPNASTAPRATRSPSEEEVRVAGQRREAGLVATFKRAEVREIPGTFGDPFRALEVMPGVTPIVSGLPFFYVRGSPPGNVGYFLDGIRVPYLFHVGLGPSVVHPGIVERVDLYGGGYPARYGRYAGGVVTAETEAPRTDAHGEWNVRLLDAGALAETGFAGDRGTILVGGRYSYTAALVSLLAPNAVLDYRDYQLRATYDVTSKDRLTFFSFGAYDLFGEKKNGALDVAFGAEFYRGDLRWDHALEDGGRVRTAVTIGLDRTLLGDDRVARMRTVSLRSEWQKPISDRALVRAGADVVFERYDTELLGDRSGDAEAEQEARVFPSRDDVDVGLRADVVYKPTRTFEVVPGARLDFFRSGGVSAVSVDPRIATKLALSPRVRLLQAHGVAHQPPSFVAPIPGLTIGSLAGGLQRGVQTSAGVEADMPLEFTGTATVFRSATLNLTDFLTSAARFDGTSDDRTFDRRATGDAYGLELFVKRSLTKRVTGLASYTLSRATQRENGQVVTGAFDRTHVLNVAGAVDLGARWRLGAKFVTYSGSPMLFGSSSAKDGKIASGRTDAFYRVDVRLEKKWMLGKRASIAFVVEAINVTLSKDHINDQDIGPITVPSLGVEGVL